MSVFFRYYINLLLSQNRYRLNIVYSGGDDVFLIGNWSDVINVAVGLRNAFKKYCGGALTLSAGIGIFPEKFPVAMAARSTAELEDKAKAFVDPATGRAKDAVCFFSPEDVYTFSWDQWETDVRAKIKQLSELFDYQKNAQDANTVLRGQRMIYRILELLRGADDKINIARYAYMLARLAPDGKDEKTDETYNKIYKRFQEKMYLWILNERDRKSLMLAILIYVYSVRESGGNQ